jgi:hypothetical protein
MEVICRGQVRGEGEGREGYLAMDDRGDVVVELGPGDEQRPDQDPQDGSHRRSLKSRDNPSLPHSELLSLRQTLPQLPHRLAGDGDGAVPILESDGCSLLGILRQGIHREVGGGSEEALLMRDVLWQDRVASLASGDLVRGGDGEQAATVVGAEEIDASLRGDGQLIHVQVPVVQEPGRGRDQDRCREEG